MKHMLLSYIVPVYNTAPYVLRCLETLVDQGIDVDDYEVVVVDDGSPDDSRSIIEGFIATHPQVRLISQPNAGLSAARNTGIKHARGRYLQFVDSDDYLEVGKIGALLRRAIEQNLDILLFNHRNVDIDGNPIPTASAADFPSTSPATGPEYLSNHPMIPYAWRYLLSADYLNRTGYRFDPELRICEDGPFMSRIMLNADRVAYEDVIAYCYVSRGDSFMHNPDPKHLRHRMMGQVEAAASINEAMSQFESATGTTPPASVAGMRNVYLYFAMTKALECGYVQEVLERIRQHGLYPFPCVGPEANYHGVKWKVIHGLMMRPRLWNLLSKVYRAIRK